VPRLRRGDSRIDIRGTTVAVAATCGCERRFLRKRTALGEANKEEKATCTTLSGIGVQEGRLATGPTPIDPGTIIALRTDR